MVTDAIKKIEEDNMKKENLPSFIIGDIVKVHAEIREGEKTRIQVFAGTVIAMDGKGVSKTFTVRRVTHGVGVEKVFPLHSPHIAKVDVDHSSHVRRAKLYFLRNLVGKKARLREKIYK